MQADLHGARSPYVLIICSLPVVFVCNALFLFLLHCTNPKQSLLMSARSSSHYERFFGDTFDVLCFHMYKLQAH